MGVLWGLLAEIGWELKTTYAGTNDIEYNARNDFTTWAWGGAMTGTNIFFGPVFLMWLLGYIKTESRNW